MKFTANNGGTVMEISIVKKELIVDGLDCAHCATKIETKVNELEEIEKATMNFMNKTLTVQINSNNVDEVISKIAKIADEVEPGSTVSLKGSKAQKPYTKIFILEGLG
jgi:Zn2+/Cd2+-exporting ATPase